VHASADGVLVVCHDPTLERVADHPGRIADMTWRELAAVRLAGSEPLPRLDELLAAWPEARFNIDAKADAAVEPLARFLEGGSDLDRVCVTSFSDRRLTLLRRRLGSALCTAAGPRQVTALRVASLASPHRQALGAAAWAGARAAQVPERWFKVAVADRRLLEAAHRAGLAVHVWTVNDTDDMERLIDAGVDGIMTDHPTWLRHVLERRGLWV
jgi:glycerophosphoryl diester phosphodiesterase